MMTIRLADVARAAGVSQGTASNVFNRPEQVSTALRERVLAAAARLGYLGPAPAGRALRSGKAHLIALVAEADVVYVLTDPFCQRLLAGIGAACDVAGSGVAVVPAVTGGGGRWSMETAIADGFVLFCNDEPERLLALATRRGLPFVAVDSGPVVGASTVRIDDRAAAFAAATHLTALGHRRVAVLSLELAPDGRFGSVDATRMAQARHAVTRDRLAGYRDALAAASVDWPSVPVYETANDRGTVDAALGSLLSNDPRPTALIAMSDVIARHAIRHLAGLGLSVPGDLSIIGFDDVPDPMGAGPPLTTIRQPIEAKGEVAGGMLLGLVEPGDVVLPAELVVRGSTERAR
ncbi:MAG: LacI family DNA-binding transcriptional regulator [Pseudomonadota bacterium]